MPVFTSHVSSSGGMQATGSAEMDFISGQTVANVTTITKDTVVLTNHNAVLYGPITINQSLKIESNSKVKIKDIDDV
jgi:hypothetical protein